MTTEHPSLSGEDAVGQTLLPCPFCRSENLIVWRNDRLPNMDTVICNGCTARGPHGKRSENDASVVAAWNTRLASSVPTADVERLREALEKIAGCRTDNTGRLNVQIAIDVLTAHSQSTGPSDERVEQVRPLDTAPTDGSYFLILGTNFDGGCAVVRWDDGQWYLDDGKNFEIALRHESKLVGWMPLPAAATRGAVLTLTDTQTGEA